MSDEEEGLQALVKGRLARSTRWETNFQSYAKRTGFARKFISFGEGREGDCDLRSFGKLRRKSECVGEGVAVLPQHSSEAVCDESGRPS
jgi:hypothetical protein